MSNDPLPISDFSTAAEEEAEYQAIFAEIMTSRRGRSFLAEYARRNQHADTQSAVDTIARLEASVREHAAAPVAAALVRGLSDLVAVIEQAAGEASDAAALLRELKSRVDGLIALAGMEPVAEPDDQPAATATVRDRAEPFDNPIREPAVEAAETGPAVAQPADSPHPLLPDIAAWAGPEALVEDLLQPPTPIPDLPLKAGADEAVSRDLLAASSPADDFSSSSMEAEIEKKSPAIAPLPQQHIAEDAAVPATPPAASNGPLAAVLALSEEELIALFS